MYYSRKGGREGGRVSDGKEGGTLGKREANRWEGGRGVREREGGRLTLDSVYLQFIPSLTNINL